MAADDTKECPNCKEEVKVEAVLCKHCRSSLEDDSGPDHDGICPYCKEDIKPDAIKCKHCKSSLAGCCGDGPSDSGLDRLSALAMMRATGGGRPEFAGGRGVITDPGHDCWGKCVDDFVNCMTTTVNRPSADNCRLQFLFCQRMCPPSGPQFF